ncbi:stealth family protein [Polaribacter sp. HaHaR_3_91]|uniref:stealth family protein n=1 Tax=Polaribacter sp. HaHaR_3_91 TaxID=2745561 RepID=UPI001C4EC846|nr:stealth family protein [Polaribacter sp. HaHaR_3_91]QXP64812.1 Stealth CR1 domain-containing protein [Polaribacter sp. HaHaR_3_91]
MEESKGIVIDAVITWVDGNDPLHKAKMRRYLDDKIILSPKGINLRYGQIGEIEFCVKSILKYATFIRHIYIVTDNQTPQFLKKNSSLYSKVKIIDHKDIFKNHENFLPTFNSRSIETRLYKIPGLSERFIYFNDDFFLLKKTKVEDFFIGDLPVLRGSWLRFDSDVLYKKIKNIFKKQKKEKRVGHKIAQQKAAQILGLKKYFKFHHTPQPLRKSTFENFYKGNQSLEVLNIKPRFRSDSQYIAQSLANHLEIKNKTSIKKNNYNLVYFQSYKKPLFFIKNKLKRAEKNQNKLFLCMQSLDQCPSEKLIYIKNWLQNKYE